MPSILFEARKFSIAKLFLFFTFIVNVSFASHYNFKTNEKYPCKCSCTCFGYQRSIMSSMSLSKSSSCSDSDIFWSSSSTPFT
jgi:hypothetical protein